MACSRRPDESEPALAEHPIEWHRGTGVECGTWTNGGLTHCSFVKALTVLRAPEGDSNAGTVVIEGSHKVPIPTAELLALAEGGLAGVEGSELVKHVPMDVGDTMFFMETLIHAAPEVRCKRLSQPPPRLLKVFAQLWWWLCCMAALLCCDRSAAMLTAMP
eukprot:COSAG06_NODE_156_length_21863_cov_29.245405_4_plen_161_part_00